MSANLQQVYLSSKTAGVYEIANETTGDRYIGQSKSLDTRLHSWARIAYAPKRSYSSPSENWARSSTDRGHTLTFRVVLRCDPHMLDFFETALILLRLPEVNARLSCPGETAYLIQRRLPNLQPRWEVLSLRDSRRT